MAKTGYKITVYLDDNPLSPTYMQTYEERTLDEETCPIETDDLVLVSNECEIDFSGYTGYRLEIYYNRTTGEYTEQRVEDPECIESSDEERWVASGDPYCETTDKGVNTGYMLQLQVQMNPELANYGEKRYQRWKSPECGSNNCPIWDEVSRQCHIEVTDCVATFDGTADIVQIDINPLSTTYNQTRTANKEDSDCENCTKSVFSWVLVGDMCGDASLLCSNGIQQTSTNSYTVSQKYKTIGNGTPIPMDEYQVVLKTEDDEDCGYIKPQYRWDAVPGQYLCDYETYTKYQMLVKMVSYDAGETWATKQPLETQRGEVLAYDSYDCGKPLYRWTETDDFVCIDNGDDYKIALIDISGTAISSVSCSDVTVTSTDYNAVRGYSYSVDDCWYYGLYEIGDCVDTIDENALRDQHQDTTHKHFLVKMGDYVTTIKAYGLETIGMCSIEGNPYNDRKPLKLSRNLRYVGRYPFGDNYDYGLNGSMKSIQFQTDNPPELIGGGGGTLENQNIERCVVPYGSLLRYRDATYLGIPDARLIQEPVLSEKTDYKFKFSTSSGTTYYYGEDGYDSIIPYEITQAVRTITYDTGVSNHRFAAELSNSITSIDNNAFSGCTSLTSIVIPNTVTSIGTSAFTYCSNLTSMNIPNGITWINSYTFYGCSSLTNIEIPSSVTTIGSYAFYNCNKVDSITCLAYTPPYLGTSAFANTNDAMIFVPCDRLEAYKSSWSSIADRIIGLPPCVNRTKFVSSYSDGGTFTKYWNGVSVINSGETRPSKYDYTLMTDVDISDGVTSIGDGAFQSTSLTGITIPNTVTSFGVQAFASTDFTSFTIPNTITSIGDKAFWGCNNLTGITIPNSVTSIGWAAFYGSDSLSSCTIGTGTTSIGKSAFGDCYHLTSCTIDSGSIGESAFSGCSRLTSCTLGTGVTSISANAFYNCSSLQNINIPSSVTTIGTNAFQNCSSLQSIHIPNAGANREAFSGCTGLQTCTIDNGRIGRSAFIGCYGMTSLILGTGVLSIGNHAFRDCSGLTSITCLASSPPKLVTTGRLDSVNHFANTGNCPILVPAGSVKAYKNATNWSIYSARIQPISS